MNQENISYIYHKPNIHHLLPRSRGGSEDKINKVQFEINQHAKFHAFFNHGIFSEQILQLIKLSDKALDENIVQELRQLLEKEPEDFYKRQAIRQEKIPKRTPNTPHLDKEHLKTLHYILPISRGWSEHDNNKEMLSVNTQRNFSEVFGDTVFPEQILQLLLLSSPALEPVIIKEVLYFMENHKLAEFFKREVIQQPWKVLPSIEKNSTQLRFNWNGDIQENQRTKAKIFETLEIMSKK